MAQGIGYNEDGREVFSQCGSPPKGVWYLDEDGDYVRLEFLSRELESFKDFWLENYPNETYDPENSSHSELLATSYQDCGKDCEWLSFDEFEKHLTGYYDKKEADDLNY